MSQTVSTVMQLFKGSYFSNSAIANGTMYVNYVSPASKSNTKNHILKRSTNETLIIGT